MSISSTKRHFKSSLRISVWSVVLIWGFFLYHRLFFIDIRAWGIFPRATWSLHDIFTAPLTHGDIYHLISNTFPLFVSMGIIFYFYRRVAWLLRRKVEPDEAPSRYSYEDDLDVRTTPFLDSDTFDRTRQERKRDALDSWWFDETS